MNNKRGDLATVILVFVVLVAIGTILFGFLGFDSSMKKRMQEINKPVREVVFNQQYIIAQASFIGGESIRIGGDLKKNFVELAGKKDLGIEGAGNFFRKTREGDFQFDISEREQNSYYLEMSDLFVISRLGINEFERNFDLKIEFDGLGNVRKVYKEKDF